MPGFTRPLRAATRGQLPNLTRHDGKALAGVTGMNRLNCRIERQNICLEGQVLDHAIDFRYTLHALLRVYLSRPHCRRSQPPWGP